MSDEAKQILIVEDEANLPSSTNLINANRERRSAFIKGDKD